MPFLEAVAVDEALVDDLWKRIEETGSFYSIGDGVSKEQFRKVMFESSLVLRGGSSMFRLEEHPDYFELHPIVFGPSAFAHARELLGEIEGIRDKMFAKKPICCIIPRRMRGAKRLALEAGMKATGEVVRQFSGVAIACTVYMGENG